VTGDDGLDPAHEPRNPDAGDPETETASHTGVQNNGEDLDGTDGQMNGSGDGPVDADGADSAGTAEGSEVTAPGHSDGTSDGTAGASRANGLTAAYYVPLRDVDPRVGVELLAKLAGAGIAAYVAPTPGDKGGYGDVHPPALPTDRLWVDGAQRAEAEALVSTAASDDEVFDQLVAMFHTSSPEVAPWPATEELGTTTRTPTWTTRRSITARQAQPPAPELTPQGEPALPQHVEDYLDEHFVPDPPPPLPRLQGITILAWALIAFGVLILVFHDQLPVDFSQGSFFIAVVAILGGFATLVYRMRDNDHNDGDGAVV
jgi:hypothetical protein